MPKNEKEKGIRALPKSICRYIRHESAPNLSLKYYKWADIYKEGFCKTIKDKKDFFKSFENLSNNKSYYQAFSIRKSRFYQMGGVQFCLKTACRLVFGIGYDHSAEIGFMFDWTTGLPIIPGSSLKGAARAAAQENGFKSDKINEIFGKELKPGEKHTMGGRIIFLPAYPLVENKTTKAFLDVDVLTPHYKNYYDKSKNEPQADNHSPEPLKFLTVPANVIYQFSLLDMECPDMTKEAAASLTEDDILKLAKDILIKALMESGIGAKTNVFYGYFKKI